MGYRIHGCIWDVRYLVLYGVWELVVIFGVMEYMVM